MTQRWIPDTRFGPIGQRRPDAGPEQRPGTLGGHLGHGASPRAPGSGRQVTAAAAPAPAPAAAGPATTPQAIGARGFNNQTVRMIVRTSIAGKRLRVRLSNAFGGTPVAVGAAHIAIRGKESAIVPDSDRSLSFNGKPGCTLGPGVVLFSDPVDLNVPAVTDLAVSLYFPGETGPPTTHATALHNTYISKEGDVDRQGRDCRARNHAVLLLARRRRRGGCRGRRGRGHLRRFHYRRRALHLGDQSQLAGPAGGAPRGRQRHREDRRGQYGDRRQSRAPRRQRRQRPGALGSRCAQPARESSG